MLAKMKLQVLLAVMERLLRRGSRRSERVRELVESADFVLQVETDDGVGAWLEVKKGAVELHRGRHAAPNFTQLWRTGADAFSVLTNSDETEILRAFEDGRLRMRGDFLVALWLNEAMRLSRAVPLWG